MLTTAKEELDARDGFVIGPVPDAEEVAWLRAFVTAKWRDVLTARYPDLRPVIEATAISDYHKIAPMIDHATTWTKDARLFSRSDVQQLQQNLSAFRFLDESFGSFEIADIEGLGYPEIYWRLVRPNQPGDVAGAHADAWFYTLTNNLSAAEQARLVKVWMPVYADIGVSGLSVGVGSQRMNLAYRGEMRHGRMKPLLVDERSKSLEMTALPLQAGQCVAFHVDLLHQGISHSTDRCRVSLEFAIRLRTA
jgi:hypothetical protein